MRAGSSETTALTRHDDETAWWRRAVGYEIYIRSFFDSDNDGLGDMDGITAKLDYIAALGVDIVWITPFYPSPGFDHGYDVSDYVGVDPRFGDLNGFTRLIDAAHQRNLRVFIDIVPNHSSSEHPWFRSAVDNPDGEHRDYYLFRPAGPDGGPPNNWVSHFGGPAWTLDPGGSGEWYCHLFLPEQPDLNWANPAVRAEFDAILTTWCERGVDGFRIDVAHGLTKDPDFRDNPQLRPVTAGMHPTEVFRSFQHVHDLHRPETAEIYRHWRALVAPYGAVLLGELDTRDVERFAAFVADGDGLDVGFVLKLASMHWEPGSIISDLLTYSVAARGGTAWALSNHDQDRAVSRFGGGATGVDRALAVTTLLVAMDGITFLYQGEELGLPNSTIIGDSQDPVTTRNDGAGGRDVARGPMPWSAGGPMNGFSTNSMCWLDTRLRPDELTADAQVDRPGSTWDRYRQLIDVRHRLPDLWTEPMEVIARSEHAVVIQKGAITVVANLGASRFEFVPAGLFQVEYESRPHASARDGGTVMVDAECTVVLSRLDGSETP